MLIQPNDRDRTNYPEVEEWLKKNFPHKVEKNSSSPLIELYKWLFQTFGGSIFEFDHLIEQPSTHISKLENPDAVWESWGDCIFFKNSQDAILFKMKWG